MIGSKGYSGVISASQIKRSPEPSVLVVLSDKCPSLRWDGIAFVSGWRDTCPSKAKYNASGSTETVCARPRALVVTLSGLVPDRVTASTTDAPGAGDECIPAPGGVRSLIEYRGGIVKGGYPALVFISPFDTKFIAICLNSLNF